MSIKQLQKRFFIVTIICLCTLAASPALAHRLNVYAWLENDQVLVECNYGKNSPAKDAQIKIIDSDTKKVLMQGITDASGRYAFTVPAVVREGHGLTIDVSDNQGHHYEWNMDASELYAAASLTAGFDQAAIEAKKADSNSQNPSQVQTNSNASPQTDAAHRAYIPRQPAEVQLQQQPLNVPMPSSSGEGTLTHEHVRAIINEALDNKLTPLRNEIAAKMPQEPGIGDIIGGLGWIIGIVGIYLYFRSRRK